MPLTVDEASCCPSACKTKLATSSESARIFTVARAAAKPAAEAVTSYVPGAKFEILKVPSSFVVPEKVSPFPTFLVKICAFEMREPDAVVIVPESFRNVTCPETPKGVRTVSKKALDTRQEAICPLQLRIAMDFIRNRLRFNPSQLF